MREDPVPISVRGLTALEARTLPFVAMMLPDASTVPTRAPAAFVTVLDELIVYGVPLTVTVTVPRPGTTDPPPEPATKSS